MILDAEELKVARKIAEKVFKENYVEGEFNSKEEAFIMGWILSREYTFKEMGIDQMREKFGDH